MTLSDIFETIGMVVTAGSALVGAIHAVIPALDAYAKRTVWTGDDAAVGKLRSVVEWLIPMLDLVRRYTPRASLGPTTKTQPLATASNPRPSMRPLSGPPPAMPVTTTLKPWPEVMTPPEDPKL
jgi:hypothetical protein